MGRFVVWVSNKQYFLVLLFIIASRGQLKKQNNNFSQFWSDVTSIPRPPGRQANMPAITLPRICNSVISQSVGKPMETLSNAIKAHTRTSDHFAGSLYHYQAPVFVVWAKSGYSRHDILCNPQIFSAATIWSDVWVSSSDLRYTGNPETRFQRNLASLVFNLYFNEELRHDKRRS